MPNLKLAKRLSASVLKCGKHRVSLDPNRLDQLASATSRYQVRKLIAKKVIMKKPVRGQSRYRWKVYTAARRAGRHMGLGKRKGTKNARTPSKKLWMDRIRVLRRLLKKYREQKKIDKSTYHKFYLRAKGNQFKNKRHLMEAIWENRDTQNKEKALLEQSQARMVKAAIKREKKNQALLAQAAQAKAISEKASSAGAQTAGAQATDKQQRKKK